MGRLRHNGAMHQLTLLRHGQSQWNLENRFTGWTGVDLRDLGVTGAKRAGRLLREGGFVFDRVYTTLLKRAIHQRGCPSGGKPGGRHEVTVAYWKPPIKDSPFLQFQTSPAGLN
jgi:hypothetical protein